MTDDVMILVVCIVVGYLTPKAIRYFQNKTKKA